MEGDKVIPPCATFTLAFAIAAFRMEIDENGVGWKKLGWFC